MSMNDVLVEQYNALKPYLFPMLIKLQIHGNYPLSQYREGMRLELTLSCRDTGELLYFVK